MDKPRIFLGSSKQEKLLQALPGAGTTVRARFPLPSRKSVAGTDQ